MYSSKFVVSVVVEGKVLQERQDGICPIPFNSEYGVKLTNKNSSRAKASLYIDEVHQGDFVIEANSSATIERPVSENRSFLFVKPDSKEAKHQNKKVEEGSKGVIRVKWHLQEPKMERRTILPVIPVKPYRPPVDDDPWYPNTPPWRSPSPTNPPWKYPTVWFGDPRDSSTTCSTSNSGPVEYSSNSIEPRTVNVPKRHVSYDVSDGVTVKGKETAQEFTTVYYVFEENYVEMRLVLKGFDGPVNQEVENYCPNDGRKKKSGERFCSICGHKFK